MYALTIVTGTISNDTYTEGKGLSDMMDKYLSTKRNSKDLAPGSRVSLSVIEGGVLRPVRQFETESAPLPALKLSDAMTKALFADEAPLVGLPGAPNTLKALEARGLVKRDNVGVARLTNLGRQYRAQKKGA